MHDPDFDPYLPPRVPVGDLREKATGTEKVEGNPWLTIWTRPRGTIRSIVNTDPTQGVNLLAVISGISSTFSNYLNKDAGDTMSLPVLIGVALIGGSIGGILGNMLCAAIFRWTGSWLGGVATYEETRAAVAWGSVPNAVNLALILVLLGVFGENLFKSGGLEGVGTGNAMVLVVVGLTQVTIGIWGIVLVIKTVAEVHKFSAWRSLGSMLLALLVFMGIVFVVVFIVIAAMAAMKAGG